MQEGLICPKLLVRDLLTATVASSQTPKPGVVFTHPELPPFDRVWLQGTAKAKAGLDLKLDDGTGEVDVKVPPSAQGIDLDSIEEGNYVLLIGKVVARGDDPSLRHIKAHKLINLAKEGGDNGAQRMLHWNLEVMELQRHVYPQLAQA